MTSKKIILISSAFIFSVLLTIFGCCIFFRQNECKIPVAKECPKVKNLEAKAIEKNLDAETKNEWRIYYDKRYKYSIDFPAGLNVTTIYEHIDTVELSEDYGGGFLTLTINGGATFSPTDLPLSVIAVEVFENSKFRSLDKWLENENSKEINRIVEKKINIDGNEAIVTYQVSMLDGKIFEEFKHAKTTVFIKDNKLFTIYTVMEDNENEKVWNSFKFEKE